MSIEWKSTTLKDRDENDVPAVQAKAHDCILNVWQQEDGKWVSMGANAEAPHTVRHLEWTDSEEKAKQLAVDALG
jgi:hypothetical protein